MSVIETLNKNEIKGTFFVIADNLKENTAMRSALKEAFDAGHKIGIRSYSDDLEKIYASEEAYFNDLYACRDLVKEITGENGIEAKWAVGT